MEWGLFSIAGSSWKVIILTSGYQGPRQHSVPWHHGPGGLGVERELGEALVCPGQCRSRAILLGQSSSRPHPFSPVDLAQGQQESGPRSPPSCQWCPSSVEDLSKESDQNLGSACRDP